MGHSRGSSDEFERETVHRDALAARTVPELGENEVTKGKLPLETGLLPREYVVCVLDAADGGLLQQEVVDLPDATPDVEVDSSGGPRGTDPGDGS